MALVGSSPTLKMSGAFDGHFCTQISQPMHLLQSTMEAFLRMSTVKLPT